MKKIDAFINQYPLMKTIKFSLIPEGKTEEYFNKRLLLEEDSERAAAYEKVKKYIDRYHKYFIENVLTNLVIPGVSEYAELYYKSGKTEKDLKDMKKAEEEMQKVISKAFKGNPLYKAIFSKEIITNLLPDFLTDEKELATVEKFRDFFTYFTGFNENRENMYQEGIKSSVAFRCIGENLPKFLDNCAIFQMISEKLDENCMKQIQKYCDLAYGIHAENMFSVDSFSFVLSQTDIDKYNGIIGGYTLADGTKVQGLNEYINLYNQQTTKQDKSKRLPFMKPLYKQILSDRETVSFIPEQFDKDNEVLTAVYEFYHSAAVSVLAGFQKLFSEFTEYDLSGIHLSSGLAVTELSQQVFGAWNTISDAWNQEYETTTPPKKKQNLEDYYEQQKKDFKKIGSFSLAELQRLGLQAKSESCNGDIATYYENGVSQKVLDVISAYEKAESLLSSDYSTTNSTKLCQNDTAVSVIKDLLDALKALERFIKPLLGTGKEEHKDSVFYGILDPLYTELSAIDRLYDKVRNYITKKPYSKNKIKLNFQNPQFLGGWDKNKERDYRTVILKKDGNYYLGIMEKGNTKIFLDIPEITTDEYYEKMEYKLLPGPNKMLPKVFFANSNLDYFCPSPEIMEIRKAESFKKGANFQLEDCRKLIDFFKESIQKHPDWSQFGFEFSPTESYQDISRFYNEVSKQGYYINFQSIPKSYINELVNNGNLYLFRIYNKDFSPYSHGAKNLHTMYFEMLFDERNLRDVVFQLNGGAEMFYREASIREEDAVVHKANFPIANKNPENEKKTSTFSYDLIKDKRFTKRQFFLHLPITLNFKADGSGYLNTDVRRAIKYSDENYTIGIDRGERHLLYLCVINSKGEIVEQKSLNEIVAKNGYKVNYHNLLDGKERQRDEARKSWGTIENIKELKEGYLSQVVHEICKLVLKYDAIIAMEDLNFGFKTGRFKVEKQVYQKFENMLISKLNFLMNKQTTPIENGGILRAYQLTNKVTGVNRGKQNGFIFYVPAYMTSKIDPTTGFVDLIKPKYTSVSDSLSLIEKIDSIRYLESEKMFAFDLDYSKFSRSGVAYRKHWTVYTNGERIRTFRNPQKNNEWDNETVVLTTAFRQLFDEYGISYQNADIKTELTRQTSKDFHQRFIKLLALTLQMRNSITGRTDVDYLVSPVKNKNGTFYHSDHILDGKLPENADANGAYNIARKALWAVEVLKQTDDSELDKANLTIKNADWFEYTQK